MVKGITRRVIVIKSPDPHIFEEAIFIVREDLINKGVTQEEIVREAREVASKYISANLKRRRRFHIPAPVFALIGAGVSAIVLLSIFLA